ncbi:alpha/beta hydrolase [Lactobacillus kefiranofaciens]|uniref:Alpha/beta hydrolase n=1 Tax=Lactobacillus kefiranofaciens TaxID=267818 RepID=A0AAX3UCA6_9LACO|nr:alpha/beta hydrolase [Lactobacillus kefiranofaciens]AEG41295.1 Cell surface hydrolase [Lactobacillus kefiranofaciens subsp. kefiranofaciens]MCJ2172536.1 alpha/beta hydrolase [Lactobacillus kefiranofaciens]MDF4142875.1 alpha/beta hydrolase [Lactobacillus kefiranofaciens]URW70973.1 alpha/beta hydrolase [Lactobacillus kefiranofaciens subsp. kefirgranum]URW72917.1 alpha/beta hydrolase [Lactobacillus kefiranofaciens subsp. kefirgranum]
MSKKQSNLGKNPNLKWLLIVIALIILLAIPGYSWMKEGNRMRAQRQKSILSPVIMVPGSSATTERFNELVNQLNRDTPTKHSVLKINVSTKGVLSYSGSIDKNDNEPFIIVGFQNNKDGYSNIKKQAGWLDQAFYDLTQNYRFNNFKAFGHSNGGLIWTYWLEHYYSTYSDEITMKRLMTAGTPYNFSEGNASHRTQMLEDFIKDRNRIPKDLVVYSLSGGKNYESDGIVPEASVAAGKYIFQNRVKNFTAMTVTGEEADHSDLPQNEQVVQVIEQHLLNPVKPKNNPNQANQNKDKNNGRKDQN